MRHKAIPLDQLEKASGRGSLVPDSCFQWKEVAMVDDDEDDPYPINAETEKRCYLSSKRLMYFFGNQFYELARTIGKGSLTSSAKLLGAKVLCREEVEGTLREAKWHFIPTIEVGHWPDDAFEFFLRKRTVMRDRRTGLSYQVVIHRVILVPGTIIKSCPKKTMTILSPPSSGQQGASFRQPASWVATLSLRDSIRQGTSGFHQEGS